MSDRERTIKCLIESMKRRFPQEGFLIHPGICFSPSNQKGMGVVTTCEIGKDEILLVIPESCRFNVSNISALSVDLQNLTKQVEQRCEQWTDKNNPGDFSLALAIMYILAQGKHESVSNEWTMVAATWPSEDEMKQTSIYYLQADGDNERHLKKLGKSYTSEVITAHQNVLRQVFESAIYPILNQSESVQRFSMNIHPDTSLQREFLWETFRYAFSLLWSRAHSDVNGLPELIPLVDLINGETSDAVNVDIAKGKWPFLKGKMFRDDCKLPCSAIYATRDLAKGESLAISYGELKPSEFLIKYATIPSSMICGSTDMVDSVCIWCPPDLVPTDTLRMRALERNGFPLQDFASGKTPLTELDAHSFGLYQASGQESPDISSMRQFFILGQLATDAEVQQNISTGRLRVAYLMPKDIGNLLCRTLDYNLRLLEGASISSKDDMKRLGKKAVWQSQACCWGVSVNEKHYCSGDTLSVGNTGWEMNMAREMVVECVDEAIHSQRVQGVNGKAIQLLPITAVASIKKRIGKSIK
eukprot:CAMPEP_0194374862 /NCGR_PEP_ID=MMETSP0174-20130528/23331_1 /TAXON_ID=216777 /ORGANISM="Proboscia alata, Strain PI-D3" /LENGTH=528 /DNA_ID=CAMNT_0039154715 /DNA_START=38 /DNA_END=1625 /DNA_ORIENTATION=+